MPSAKSLLHKTPKVHQINPQLELRRFQKALWLICCYRTPSKLESPFPNLYKMVTMAKMLQLQVTQAIVFYSPLPSKISLCSPDSKSSIALSVFGSLGSWYSKRPVVFAFWKTISSSSDFLIASSFLFISSLIFGRIEAWSESRVVWFNASKPSSSRVFSSLQ